ncbi:universal stress protein [Saccharopolyspora spinosporotrichia]
MPESGRDCVVAGFDLSDASRRAVWWAAAEAASRHRPLLLVHVFVWPFAELTQVTVPGQREIMEPLKDALRRELQTLVAGCRELAPDVDVRDDMPFGDPAEELAAKAEDAALLVLGAVGTGVPIGASSARPRPSWRRAVRVLRWWSSEARNRPRGPHRWWWAWTGRRSANARSVSPSTSPRGTVASSWPCTP